MTTTEWPIDGHYQKRFKHKYFVNILFMYCDILSQKCFQFEAKTSKDFTFYNHSMGH